MLFALYYLDRFLGRAVRLVEALEAASSAYTNERLRQAFSKR